MKRKNFQRVQSLFVIIMIFIMMLPGTSGTNVAQAAVGDPVDLRINGNSDGKVAVAINGGDQIVYDSNATISVSVGDEIVLKAIPTRSGYVFDRWVLGGSLKPTNNPYTLIISDSPPTIGTQFHAGNYFTVTFNPGAYGDLVNATLASQTILEGQNAQDPGIKPDTGFQFIDWEPSDLTGITEDTTFEARYSRIKYTVTFDSGEGVFEGNTEGIDQLVAFDGTAVPPTVALVAPEGYHFTGWAPENMTNIKADSIFTAQYAKNTFTVTFNPGDNGVLAGDGNSIFAVYGEYIDESVIPQINANDGWDFDGWDIDFASTPITGNMLATAKYVQQEVVSPVVAPVTEEPDDLQTLTTTDPETAPVLTIAQENDEVVGADEDIVALDVEINDDPIAQASVDEGFNFWWLLLLLLPLLFFILWWNRVVPIVDGVADNKDGTFTVTWGYNNRKIKDVAYDQDDSMVNLLTGTIIQGEEPPVEFERGRHERVFKTIVDKNAKVEWNIKRKKALADVLEQLKKSN